MNKRRDAASPFFDKEYEMTLTVKATLAAMKMPLVVEKDGQRYSLDIADDEQGTDLVITKEEVEK